VITPISGTVCCPWAGTCYVNPHTNFEVSIITCNEDMKGNAKICKNSSFSHPLGDLGVTHRVYLWLKGKRIVHFLLVIIKIFSLAITAEALLNEIGRNRRFPTGVGHFERKF